jgi:hypothetical protein
MSESELVVAAPARPLVEVAMSEASEIARNTVCRTVITKTAIEIQKRKYVRVEGWRAIAAAHGCTLCSHSVERVYDDDPDRAGYRATGEVRRMSDGAIIATAEGFVGDHEKMWATHAKRAMAQTRAQSRAGKSAFDYVVVLMADGFETTPAEEMQAIDVPAKPAPVPPVPDQSPRKLTVFEKGCKKIASLSTVDECNAVFMRTKDLREEGELNDREVVELQKRCKARALELEPDVAVTSGGEF